MRLGGGQAGLGGMRWSIRGLVGTNSWLVQTVRRQRASGRPSGGGDCSLAERHRQGLTSRAIAGAEARHWKAQESARTGQFREAVTPSGRSRCVQIRRWADLYRDRRFRGTLSGQLEPDACSALAAGPTQQACREMFSYVNHAWSGFEQKIVACAWISAEKDRKHARLGSYDSVEGLIQICGEGVHGEFTPWGSNGGEPGKSRSPALDL